MSSHSILMIVSLLSALEAPANADYDEILADPGSEVRLLGDSTLHKYETQATQLKVTGKVTRSNKNFGESVIAGLRDFTLTIQASDLRSGDGSLDEHLREAIKAAQYPEIRVLITKYQVTGTKVTAEGSIDIAGVTKPVSLEATLKVEKDGVRITGEKKLLMTDYGIDPPTMFLGVLKTDNEVTIRFNLLLNRKSK